MVAKISTGKSVVGALLYNQDKVEKQEADVFLSNKMINVVEGDNQISVSQIMKGFEVCLTANNKTKNPVIHISLNPDPKDNLSPEDLKSIVRKYMEEMGYGNQPYIGYLHKDIDRTHLHLVSLRVDETGKKIDDSFEKRKSMDVCRRIEQELHLHPANKKEQRESIPLKKIDYKKGDIKHQVSNIVKSLSSNYRFQSLNELRTLLEQLGVTIQEAKGTAPNGRNYHGLLYSVVDDKGNQVGAPIKSSQISQSVGSNALIKKCEQSAKLFKSQGLPEKTKQTVSACLQSTKNRSQFENKLKKNGIEVVFRENENGRIYGVTFINHNEKTVLNGSRLGKEFSANAFHNLFSGKQELEGFSKDINENIHKNWEFPAQERESTLENVIGGLFDILPVNENNPEENLPIPKPKKKKKQRKIY